MPKNAVHGVFDFKDWTTGQTATTTVHSKVRCRRQALRRTVRGVLGDVCV